MLLDNSWIIVRILVNHKIHLNRWIKKLHKIESMFTNNFSTVHAFSCSHWTLHSDSFLASMDRNVSFSESSYLRSSSRWSLLIVRYFVKKCMHYIFLKIAVQILSLMKMHLFIIRVESSGLLFIYWYILGNRSKLKNIVLSFYILVWVEFV